jgi:hypothetical protein
MTNKNIKAGTNINRYRSLVKSDAAFNIEMHLFILLHRHKIIKKDKPATDQNT